MLKINSAYFQQYEYTAPTEFTRKQTYIISFPVLSMCMYPFRYHYDPFRYLFGPFRYNFGLYQCLFGLFQSLSVLFSVYSYRPNRIEYDHDGEIDVCSILEE